MTFQEALRQAKKELRPWGLRRLPVTPDIFDRAMEIFVESNPAVQRLLERDKWLTGGIPTNVGQSTSDVLVSKD